MSEPERAESTSTSARSLHVVHLIPVSWPEVAARIAPLITRVDRTVAAVQVLALVPTGDDASELMREVLALDAARDVRIAPLSAPRRSRRFATLAASATPQVVIGTIETVGALIKSSALSLSAVSAVLLGAADELESDEATLEQVLAELPKGAARLLTAATATPFVDRIMERHMHGARRVSAAPVDPAVASATRSIEVRAVSAAAPAAGLGDVLESVDALTVAIVPADARREHAVRASLAVLGFGADSALVRVVPDGATGGAPLVVLVGSPSVTVLAAVLASPLGRTIALVTARERATLAAAAPSARMVTFTPASALSDAAAAEERQREQIRRVIRDGLPSREMLALEPLLSEFDPLVLAGAALQLYERTRESARKSAEVRPAAAASAPSERSSERSSERPRERSPRGSGPPREGGFSRAPRKFDGPSRGGGFSRGPDDRPRPPRDRDGPSSSRGGPRPPFKPRPKPTRGRDDQ